MLTSPQKRLLAEMDVDKRKAERRVSSGGLEAQSRELVQRMRAGELTRDRVELLSYLGYEPAQQLIPTTPPANLEDFARFGSDVLVMIAIISARAALPIWEAAFPDDDRPRKAIEAAEAGDAAAARDAARAVVGADVRNAAALTDTIADAAYAAAAAAYTAFYVKASAISLVAASAVGVTRNATRAGVKNIRELIEQGLIEWVLNGN